MPGYHLRCIYCIPYNRCTVVELVFTMCYVNFTVRYDLHIHSYKIYRGRDKSDR